MDKNKIKNIIEEKIKDLVLEMDELRQIAKPIEPRFNTIYCTVLDFIENYVLKNKVGKIVIGEPKSLSGGQTHSSDMVQKFHHKMTKSFPEIEIKFYDERFTSKIAMQIVLDSGIKKMKRRKKETLDKIAAVIILQDYLKSEEFQRSSNT